MNTKSAKLLRSRIIIFIFIIHGLFIKTLQYSD